MGRTPNHHNANRRPQDCANGRANQQSQREGLAVSAWTRTAINAKGTSAITFSYMTHAGGTRLGASHPKTGSAVIHLPTPTTRSATSCSSPSAFSLAWRAGCSQAYADLLLVRSASSQPRFWRILARGGLTASTRRHRTFSSPLPCCEQWSEPRCWPVLALLVVFSRATFA